MGVFWTVAAIWGPEEGSTRIAPQLSSLLIITSTLKLPFWLLRPPCLYWETSETQWAIKPSSGPFQPCLCLPEKHKLNNIPHVDPLFTKWHVFRIHLNSSFHRLFSVKQVPALVFVMDTTGSMFEEITAARLRAHSIIQSRANGPGQPGTFLLVPFHDPGEGTDISEQFGMNKIFHLYKHLN